jgi:signal recognition particle subunit SEC65|tara:strand:- start:758 stop:943 length:186 start_codon:yes stop_codon:yes gene_type:complete
MTLPKQQKIKEQNIKSMKNAVEEVGIQAIHPDKMEEFAEYLVQNARKQESASGQKNEPLQK